MLILENLFELLIIFFAFGGFLLSIFIHHKKNKREKVICPRGYHCDIVIWSVYSKLWGIPLEILGMIYYTFIALAYAIFLIFPELFLTTSSISVFFSSIIAFFVSLYLTAIQVLKLRHYCTWCLISAGLSTLILIFSSVIRFVFTG